LQHSVRQAGLIGLITLCAALTAGCADRARTGPEGNDAGAPGLKVYKHSMDQSPSTLDPAHAANIYANHVVVNAYDTLFSYQYLARPYQLKPNLASGWPEISPDGLEYTIRLKPGVHFVDDPAFPGGIGREVTAADVVYSIQRHFHPATRSQGTYLWQNRIVGLDEWKTAGSDYAAPVEGLQALDRHTLRIRLLQPYPQLLYTLAQGYSAVVPREAVDHYGREFAVRPVGSGPFRVTHYDSARITMVRNPNYRQEPVDLAAEGYNPVTQGSYGLERVQGRSPPFVDRLHIYFIGESSARWNSFTKGDEVQYTTVPNEQFDRVLASRKPIALTPDFASKYHMYAGREAGFIFSTFNMSFPEFGYNPDPERERRNKALRCAILKAFDWDGAQRELLRRHWRDLSGHHHPGRARIRPGHVARERHA
jgi:oligopeptide transport system substrate-binding protein